MDSTSGLRAVFLGSGSAGNCTAIVSDETLVLVDCGFSAREVSRRLEAAGLDPARVSAVLVTHEHGDHVRGIEVFCRRHSPECAVVATSGTRRAAGSASLGGSAQSIRPGDALRIGDLEIVAFRTSHDAEEPVGYRISGGGQTIGIATDTGVLTPEAREALRDVDVLAIEGNHDVRMLEQGPYPYHLKRRILSAKGHLSNADAARALEVLAGDRLKRVVAMHRSRTNNTSAIAATVLRERLKRLGLAVPVDVAEQHGGIDTRPPQGSLLAP